MLRTSVLGIVAAALLAAGCGSDPQRPPDVGAAGPPGPLLPFSSATQGILLDIPGAWKLEQGPPEGPLVVQMTSGRATIAVWRYPRSEPLPRTRTDLEATSDSLVAAIKTRDPEYAVTSTRILRDASRRGVEVIGTGTNSGFPRRMRSLHLFGAGAEVVLDMYTTPEQFATVDGDVFREVARSLRIRTPTS